MVQAVHLAAGSILPRQDFEPPKRYAGVGKYTGIINHPHRASQLLNILPTFYREEHGDNSQLAIKAWTRANQRASIQPGGYLNEPLLLSNVRNFYYQVEMDNTVDSSGSQVTPVLDDLTFIYRIPAVFLEYHYEKGE
jgi:hypothetical protein